LDPCQNTIKILSIVYVLQHSPFVSRKGMLRAIEMSLTWNMLHTNPGSPDRKMQIIGPHDIGPPSAFSKYSWSNDREDGTAKKDREDGEKRGR
jgi:hypothetical protein